MRSFILLFVLFYSFNNYATSFKEFLKLREKLYKVTHDSKYHFPLIGDLAKSSKRKRGQKIWNKLKTYKKNPALSSKERKLVTELLDLDKSTNFSPKNFGVGLKGGYYVTPFGLRISTKCFKFLDKSREQNGITFSGTSFQHALETYSDDLKTMSPEFVDTILTNQVSNAVEKVSSCGENYSSVKSNTTEWLKVLKKTTIKCTNKTASETGTLGYHINNPMNPNTDVYLAPETFFKMMVEPTELKNEAAAGRNTLVHEIFHLTHHENRSTETHNSYGGVVSEQCNKPDRLTDRVYFLTALCSRKRTKVTNTTFIPKNRKFSHDELMAQKVNKCGMKRGCVEHFTDSDTSEKEAQKFCQQVVSMGQCKIKMAPKSFSKLSTDIKTPMLKLYSKVVKLSNKCIRKEYKNEKEKILAGCPSQRNLNTSQNYRLLYLMEFVQKNGREEVLNTFLKQRNLVFLSQHPRTKAFLEKGSWNTVLEHADKYSDASVTHHCKEYLSLVDTLNAIPLKTDRCKLKR